MNEPRNGIEDPANGTCEWLSKHPTYLKWFDQQHGMLWIKGKPGAGKSTLIKHAVWCLERLRGGDAVLASFFFHGRGALIQKTTAGIFRSLLHQLLPQLPELLKEFSGLHQTRIESEGQYGAKWEWHERELQNFFKARVPRAARTRTVRLYIDALDEAGEDTATELVEYFQRLSSSLAVCFSCRHYPLLTLENGLELCVEDRNGRDIDTYIRISLNARILPENIAHPVHEDIAAKSSGSFQWVALVIRLILRLYKDGNSLAVLRSKIKQLPSKLSGLYNELLGSVDEENLSESLILMQWLLFAFRPLRLSEIRFALVMGQKITCTSIRECQSSSFFSSTDEELKRKVLALSKGLVEVREPQRPRKDRGTFYRHISVCSLQFIHQSVKDFLLEGGLQLLDRGHLNDTIGRGHLCISRSCIRYLSLEDVRHFSHEQLLDRGNHTVLPLLDYAARFWHIHSEEVEKRDPVQADLLSLIWRSSDTFTRTWIRVSQMIGLDNAQDFPEAHWNLIHVASRLNLPSVVSAMIDQDSVANLKVRGGRTPLSIATSAGSDEVVKMLLDRHAVQPNSPDDYGCTPIFHAVRSRRKATLKLLLDRETVNPNLHDGSGNSPLSSAIIFGFEDMVAILLQGSNVDADYGRSYGDTPLFRATKAGFQAVMKLLLDRKDIDPNVEDFWGRTPLSYAAERGKEAVVKLLLDRKDIDPNAKDSYGRSPLSYAAIFCCEGVVKLLLDRKDIDANTQDCHGITPLSHAAERGEEAIVKLLLNRKDIKPNVKDDAGWTPLYCAAA